MSSSGTSKAFLLLLLIQIMGTSPVSYNQPKFCSNATWNANAATFADSTSIGENPWGIFVKTDNTIFVADRTDHRVVMWLEGITSPTRYITSNFSSPFSIFVTMNDDIYVGNNIVDGRVDRYSLNTNTSTAVMSPSFACFGLFVDINDTLYCSMRNHHQVVKKWSSDNTNATKVAAGTGTAGSNSTMLFNPYGIFVDINFDLYVADCSNDRIQRFHSGELDGTTMAGDRSLTITFSLNCPTGIVLDGDKYLFIVDNNNHRIVGSGPSGFRCLVGCSVKAGSASDQLYYPTTLSFDSYGNMFVTDPNNHRVQRFDLTSGSCNQTTSSPTQTTTSDRQQETTTVQQGSTTMITTSSNKSPATEGSCFPPMIKLMPGASSELSCPLQFRRSQDFYILSSIELNCNHSTAMQKTWTIVNCTELCFNKVATDKTMDLSASELYVPSNTLPYGTYQINLTVTMMDYPSVKNLSTIYVKITPSGINANLVSLGTSMITSGHQQNLTLNPGKYSLDPDRPTFNTTDWIYRYFCRVYHSSNNNGSLLPIDDSSNSPCSSNPAGHPLQWNYTGLTFPPESSIQILADSLRPGETYQFVVMMENRRNVTQQATGYVLVQIEDSNRPMIAIGCVIWKICAHNLEYQLINPTTQVALFSRCQENCPPTTNITWNIYYGALSLSWNYTRWTLFDQMISYENLWFFGRNTTNFTSTNQLFVNQSSKTLWRFEVVYQFAHQTSTSALNFKISPKPSNGTCSIDPSNGTTSTVFQIICSSWSVSEDDIRDYSLYYWTTDRSKLQIISFSPIGTFSVRLPSGKLNLVVHIRDFLDSIGEHSLASIEIGSNLLGKSADELKRNSFIQTLVTGSQNEIGQAITSISSELDQINNQTMHKATSSGIQATTISISSLGSERVSQNVTSSNESAMLEYEKELNDQANFREYLIQYTSNLTATSVNSIKLQSLSLVQLTQPTNQLTRSTLTIASTKCHQLAQFLHSERRKFPFEDVQMAATQLLQCASNVIAGVNGPLQQRTRVLNADSTRATDFPADYDTNLDFEWTNPNLFADGDDFSPETIRKGRIYYYQQQLADEIRSRMNDAILLLTATLNIHLNLGQNFFVNTPEIFLSLETVTVGSLLDKQIKQVGDAQIDLPSQWKSTVNLNQTVSVRSIVEPMAMFGQSKPSSSSHTDLSTMISLSILDQDGNELPFETKTNDLIEIIIPRDPNLFIPDWVLQNVTSTVGNRSFQYHYVNTTNHLPMSVHVELSPEEENISYLLIYKFDGIPVVNSSMENIDGWTLLCPWNLTSEGVYRYMISHEQTSTHRSVVFGLREVTNSCSNRSTMMKLPSLDNDFTSDYRIRLYSSGCYHLDENNQWNSDGSVVGPSTDLSQTQCLTKHRKKIAGGLRIFPASVNWNYVLAHLDFAKNKTIYLTVICVCVIYLILMIYARQHDKKDLEKLGVIPLQDNRQDENYFYHILVFTGQRREAGTESKVYFRLSGDREETKIRAFSNSHRKIFQRAGIDSFVMSVPKSLGSLTYLHLWHDNSGKDAAASWFLKYIIIRDLQTMEKSYFIAQRWFAVEKDDGKVERAFPIANENEREKLSYLLSKQVYHRISDGHLWFSIFSRPPSKIFTRVQRCTCCFVLFILSMFFNIMYYNLKEDLQTNQSANPFVLINLEQILVGMIIEVISLVISLGLVQLFRRLRPRHHQISPHLSEPEKRKTELTLPWWFVFLAYGISVIIALFSIIFIVARGIEYGDVRCQQWLASIVSGFFSSLFLTQPLKIFVFTIFSAYFCRTTDDKEAKDFLTEVSTQSQTSQPVLSSPIERLNQGEIADARAKRLKQVQMWSCVREISVSFLFLIFLSLIISSNHHHHSNSHLQVQHLRRYFQYSGISTHEDYWNWLNENFLPKIHAQKWYNGRLPRHLTGFMNDTSNRLIGPAIMRQLRIQSHLCASRKIVSDCHDDYSLHREEKVSFEPGWKKERSSSEEYLSINKAFQYQSHRDLHVGRHHTYSGNGYVHELRGTLLELRRNVSQLIEHQWLDAKTRAVFIQLTLYNPNVQLFTAVTFLSEFLSTGGVDSQLRIEPIHFYELVSFYQIVCLIIYFIIIFYFLWFEIHVFFEIKWKYFIQLWSYVQIGIIVSSWTSLGIYIWQYQEFQRIAELFQQTNGYRYISLRNAVYINDLRTSLFAFCMFLGMMRFVRPCRFSPRPSLFVGTLKYSRKEFLSFPLMFSLIFLSFAYFFFLFLVFVNYICLGMFLSIINDHFPRARAEANEQPEVLSMIFKQFLFWTGLRKATFLEMTEEIDSRMRSQYIHSKEDTRQR